MEMGYYSDLQEAKADKAQQRNAQARERRDAGRFKSKLDTEQFEGAMDNIPGDLLLKAALVVVREGACFSLAATRDKQCLVVTILDGSERTKTHLRSDVAAVRYLAELAGEDVTAWLTT